MYLLLSLFLGLTALASDIPESTLTRLRKLYPDQSESFLRTRVNVATTSFAKWTAFPPYFYELVSRSEDLLKGRLAGRNGFCAGDAHLENFGFLFNQGAKFSLNDLDDSSQCLLNADALRLYMGHRMLSKFNPDKWMQSYEKGLNRSSFQIPDVVQALKKKSEKKGLQIKEKIDQLLQNKSCQGEYAALTSSENSLLTQYVKATLRDYVFGCSRVKSDGGSAGNKRFIVFYQQNGSVAAEELKPLVTPAPMFNRVPAQAEREQIFKNAVINFFGPEFSAINYVVRLQGKSYQRRPLIAGNVAVKDEGLSSHDLDDVVYYEAYVLGKYHSVSTHERISVPVPEFDKLGSLLLDRWKSEFAE